MTNWQDYLAYILFSLVWYFVGYHFGVQKNKVIIHEKRPGSLPRVAWAKTSKRKPTIRDDEAAVKLENQTQ